MYKKFIFPIIIILFSNFHFDLFSQVTGGKQDVFEKDSVIVFDPSSPLLTLEEINQNKTSVFGFDLIFSTFGFGGGLFWKAELNDEFIFLSEFFISGIRKSDELERFNQLTGELFIPFKQNRLYTIPFSFGVQYYPFNNQIISTFKPFISAGAGFSFIILTPYDRSFFNAFSYGEYYTRPAFNLSIGADFGNKNKSNYGFQIKYISVPFGEGGLQSLKAEVEDPITNFGGVFLDLKVGFNY